MSVIVKVSAQLNLSNYDKAPNPITKTVFKQTFIK